MISKITPEEYKEMYQIVGAAMEVYNQLGRGMEEPIYQEALEMELIDMGIEPGREKILHTYYKGRQMEKFYQADFFCMGVMVELKSASQIHSEHRAQLMNYMRITHTRRGLLINFGEKSLRAERYIYQDDTDDFALLSEYNYKNYITSSE